MNRTGMSEMTTQKITLLGPVVVQERPRRGKYGNFYDPSSEAKKALGMRLLCSRLTSGNKVLTGELSVHVEFFDSRRFDVDNAFKALADSANKILWDDDSQIRHIDAWKHPAEKGKERTEMAIEELK